MRKHEPHIYTLINSNHFTSFINIQQPFHADLAVQVAPLFATFLGRKVRPIHLHHTIHTNYKVISRDNTVPRVRQHSDCPPHTCTRHVRGCIHRAHAQMYAHDTCVDTHTHTHTHTHDAYAETHLCFKRFRHSVKIKLSAPHQGHQPQLGFLTPVARTDARGACMYAGQYHTTKPSVEQVRSNYISHMI